MVRAICLTLIGLCGFAGIISGEGGSIDVAGVGGAEVKYETVEYTRELWIGLTPDGIEQKAFLAALRAACSDTTAVGVVRAQANSDVTDDPIEVEVLASLSSKQGVRRLIEKLDIDRRNTRVIVVGMFETSLVALRVGSDSELGVDGIVLIDPPVGDIRVDSDRRFGVDVFLGSSSKTEFERQEGDLVDRLGNWGTSARIIHTTDRFQSMTEHLTDVWQKLRGYRVMQDDAMDGSLTAAKVTARLKGSQVIFVGELHGNPGAHQVELEVLKAMFKQGGPLALATEQFERDTQQALDDYLGGKLTEDEFRKNTRAWPNYADYRPLIEFCKANKVPVIAGNVPRRLANRVYKEGVEVLSEFTADEKSWSAPEVNATTGAYRNKFFEAMGGMEGHSDAMERMYASQCFKDDTMAESVANWLKENPKGRVLHINGNFHSKGGLGVPEKLSALMPDVQIGLITCTSEDDEEAAPEEWIIKVPAPRPMRRSESNAGGH
ncbi:MAG: ChaN family lipoprotein [Planctomycetes bacterium]|nr:ChaN family lipoprotein [Planctomycetota bacterium]